MEVFDDMNLYITPEKFYIEPRIGNTLMVIDRVSEEVRVEGTSPFKRCSDYANILVVDLLKNENSLCLTQIYLICIDRTLGNDCCIKVVISSGNFDVRRTVNAGQIPASSSRRAVCGILGCVGLLAGKYLVVATHRLHVGYINGQAIWRLAGSDLIPYTRSDLHLTTNQLQDNKVYISMIENVLNTPYLYFSYTYDLTHTLQRLHNTAPDFLQLSLFERSDARFVWNGYMLKNISKQENQQYLLPLIQGFISINQCVVNGRTFTWTIVSRRSTQRAGTRLFRRGVDHHGHVANFVETEQIVEYLGDRASFVQTRGSIPLFWQQQPDLRYKPPPKLVDGENQIGAFSRHFDTQLLNYGRQVLINLIDHRGAEQTLETAFSNAVMEYNNSNIRYESFDFHHECRRMRWDRLSILLDRLAHEQDDFSYFLLTRDGTVVSQQDGVFRTNCVDCLDRTNVVQSMLARRALTNVLRKLHIIRAEQSVEQFPSLESLFKQVWADNADLISIQYSGTGALKTDFTRTGKRTKMGLVWDGLNSMTRYYKNNFADGFRQDSIDLFLGHYIVMEGEGTLKPCPLRIDRGWKYIMFPSVLLVAIAMFMTWVVFPPEYTTETLLYLLFWGSMVIVTGVLIMRFGPEFVDKPKLC